MIHGKRLRVLREVAGLSASKTADDLGISKSQLLRYETGRGDATAEVLVKLARYFKVSTDYLVGLARDPDPPDPAPYLDYDWPPATTDELRLMDETRKGNFEEAAKLLMQMHREWVEKHQFDFPDNK